MPSTFRILTYCLFYARWLRKKQKTQEIRMRKEGAKMSSYFPLSSLVARWLKKLLNITLLSLTKSCFKKKHRNT
jgi:hypothetical protein